MDEYDVLDGGVADGGEAHTEQRGDSKQSLHGDPFRREVGQKAIRLQSSIRSC